MIHFPVAVYEAMTALLNEIYLWWKNVSLARHCKIGYYLDETKKSISNILNQFLFCLLINDINWCKPSMNKGIHVDMLRLGNFIFRGCSKS